MKQRKPSLLFTISNLSDYCSMIDAINFIRRVNMNLNSKGFAANKGLTDDYFCNAKEHVWIFDTKKARSIALKRLNEFLGNKGLYTMKTTTTILSKRNSISSPRLSKSLKAKWLNLVSMSKIQK